MGNKLILREVVDNEERLNAVCPDEVVITPEEIEDYSRNPRFDSWTIKPVLKPGQPVF